MKVYRDLYFHLCALYNTWQIVKEKCTKTLFLNKWVQSHSLCFKDTVQSKGEGFIWFDTFCLLAVKTQVEKKEFCSQNPTVADGWRAAELVNSLVMKVWWDPISLISSSENQKIYICAFPKTAELNSATGCFYLTDHWAHTHRVLTLPTGQDHMHHDVPEAQVQGKPESEVLRLSDAAECEEIKVVYNHRSPSRRIKKNRHREILCLSETQYCMPTFKTHRDQLGYSHLGLNRVIPGMQRHQQSVWREDGMDEDSVPLFLSLSLSLSL